MAAATEALLWVALLGKAPKAVGAAWTGTTNATAETSATKPAQRCHAFIRVYMFRVPPAILRRISPVSFCDLGIVVDQSITHKSSKLSPSKPAGVFRPCLGHQSRADARQCISRTTVADRPLERQTARTARYLPAGLTTTTMNEPGFGVGRD